MALLLNPLADARSMALLHHARVRRRFAISLAGARSMALLHNAPRITANHSRGATVCATANATANATAFEALFALYSYR
jgi:hypothetical protein